MAFNQFNSSQYFKTLDTGEVSFLGSFSMTEDTQLKHIRLGL